MRGTLILSLERLILMVPLPFRRLDLREDGPVIQDYLQEKTGQRTVPNIFISEFRQLSDLSRSNDLHSF